jgi:hypothetical protein
MDTKPRRRRGFLIFFVMFLLVAGAISTTVLLANNRRNLNTLLRAVGIPVTETMVIPKPGTMEKFRGKRLKGVTVMLDPHVFMQEIAGYDSAFLRNMKKDGETLCAMFDRVGFKMSAWQPGGLVKSVHECYSEATFPNPEQPEEPSTFFLMVKGRPDGTLVSARVKFIFTTAEAREKLTAMTATVMEEFARATHWTEIATYRQQLLALQPFEVSLGGVSVRFFAEFSGSGRYNLIFSRANPLTKAEQRTEDYFDRGRFFTMTPDYGGPPFAAEPAKT